MKVAFKIKIFDDYAFIAFDINNGIIAPEALKALNPPDPIKHKFAHKGVLLSGRGPIWLYGFLIHYYHPTRWIATFDPRLQAAVVVESHDPSTNVGDLIPLPENLLPS